MLRPKGLTREQDWLNVENPKTRYGYIQRMVNEWWKLWMQHFVPNLQMRNKWFKERKNVSIGDVVLVIDSNIPRSKWQLAIIIETFPGNDGHIRSVKIRTSSGQYTRPITKLCLLLTKEELQNSN